MDRQVVHKPDGRSVIFYGFSASACVEPRPAAPAADADPPPAAGVTERLPAAAELRWNPVLREWVATAALRQDRTYFPPPDYCPLCPTREGSHETEIPRSDYEIVVFENRFPAFTPQSAGSLPEEDDLYAVAPARGVCEVVVYSPRHDATLTQLPERELRNLIAVWADRYAELGALPYVEYVYVFENKGREIGVTLQHPHGQIYALPFVPPIPRRELDAAREHLARTGRCLFCDIMERECAGAGTAGSHSHHATRVVAENDGFVAFIPFFARWPYETHVYPRRHFGSLVDMTMGERAALAHLLKTLLGRFDALFGRALPYVMAMHQSPTDGAAHPYHHFHIEFYPPYRTADKLKYLAGVEVGAGQYLNDTIAEEKAAELRATAGGGEASS